MVARPTLSIIIPTYNVAPFVKQALHSVLGQNAAGNIEVIVVDDGSDDDTVRVIETVAAEDGRIKLARNQRRKGAAGARNTAMLQSAADWIAFLDADDLLAPESIARRLSVLQRYPDVDLVSGGYVEAHATGGRRRSSREEAAAALEAFGDRDGQAVRITDPVIALLRQPKLMWTGTVMARRTLIDKVGLFDEDYVLGEDRDLWLRLAAKAKGLIFLDRDLAVYRLRERSLTRQGIPGSIWAAKSVRKLWEEPAFASYKRELSRAIARYQLNNSYYYRAQKDYIGALRAGLSTVRHAPGDVLAWRTLIAATVRR